MESHVLRLPIRFVTVQDDMFINMNNYDTLDALAEIILAGLAARSFSGSVTVKVEPSPTRLSIAQPARDAG